MGSAVFCALGMVNVQKGRWRVLFYGFPFYNMRKTCLLCCVGRRALSWATGVGFKWHARHGPVRVQVFLSVEKKTEIWTGNTVQVTGANWHFTWRLTTNCPPAGTSEPTESDACLTGSVCKVYISPPHSTPCDSLLCSIVQLHLCQRLIIRAL